MPALISLINIPFLIVGAAVAISAILGAVVFLNDRQSVTGASFLLFSLAAVLWNICNYLFYQPGHTPAYALLLLRLVVLFAVWYCFFLFQLFYVFPNREVRFPKTYQWGLLPIVIATSILNLTPLVFKSITGFDEIGRVATVANGWGIFIFGAVVVSLIVSAAFILISKLAKTVRATPEREQFYYILAGAIITFSLLIIFNMVLPAFFNISQYTALGAVFTLPFSIFTSYAIIKYRLFNVKVIATELLTFALWFILLFRALTSVSLQDEVIDVGLLIATVILGIFLIRSVLREVEQKEELAKLNLDLKELIKQRESLVHLVTHKVKGSFTRSKFIFAGLLDGTLGPVSDMVKKYASEGLESDNNGIETVDLVLSVANMQNGLIKYDMKPINFREILEKTIEEKRGPAEAKGLKLEVSIAEGNYMVLGDPIWLKEVVHNLIENSTKYTKVGTITITLSDGDGKVTLMVKDTGIGIKPEDEKSLFTEGGRGKDSIKVNVDSTGYGLYSVKLIVEAHHGKVWEHSDGENKGSTFYVELPAIQ